MFIKVYTNNYFLVISITNSNQSRTRNLNKTILNFHAWRRAINNCKKLKQNMYETLQVDILKNYTTEIYVTLQHSSKIHQFFGTRYWTFLRHLNNSVYYLSNIIYFDYKKIIFCSKRYLSLYRSKLGHNIYN